MKVTVEYEAFNVLGFSVGKFMFGTCWQYSDDQICRLAEKELQCEYINHCEFVRIVPMWDRRSSQWWNTGR